jgi:hypothetical protein
MSASATGTFIRRGSATSSTSATDNNPYVGTTYYKVKAINSVGESDFSSVVSCTYPSGGGNNGGNNGGSTTAPTAPSSVEAEMSAGGISVSWSSVSGATSYEVYQASSATGSYSKIGTSTSTSYYLSSATEGRDYYFKVKAVNSAGSSALSSYGYVKFENSPCPVTYGSCTASGSTITMRWTVPTSSGCGTPTKAYLRVRNPLSGVYTDVETLSGTATSVSFAYGMWANTEGLVYVGIITENSKGTSGGIPKVYNKNTNTWY